MGITATNARPVPVDQLCERIRHEAVGLGHHVRYVDLSGDGVPDSVLTLDRRPIDGHRGQEAVEEVVCVAVGIGVDGRPAAERRYERIVRSPLDEAG
jgi:hypothetical protein